MRTTTGKRGRHFLSGVTGIRYTHLTSLLSHETDSLTQGKKTGNRDCVYCGSAEHKSVDCNKVVSVAERKKHLSEKRLCFNCTCLVPNTEQQSVVSREVARSVTVDITRQSVMKNSHSYC